MLSFIAKPFVWAHHNPRVLRIFAILDKIIASINKTIAVMGLTIGVLITAINVFCRYLTGLFPDTFQLSLTWAEEVARYCFLWSAFFGAAYGFRKGVHISVTMLLDKFPPKLAKACVISIHIINSLFLAFMAYAGIMVCYDNYMLGYMSEALHNVPLWIFLLCLPFAFFGATYRSIEKIYEVSWTDADKVVRNAETEMIHDSVIKKLVGLSMSVAYLLLVLFGLLLLGVPVSIALGVSAISALFFFTSYNIVGSAEIMFNGLKPALMAIPMFILAGSLMSKGSSAQRIISFATSLVGHLPGGLPMSAILACIIFAAVSGSSPATVIAVGSVMFVAIKNAGYPKSYAVGAVTSAGSLGILIPPSVVMIVYGVTAEVSIEKLFIAGIVPGVMIGAMMMLYAYIGAKRLGFKASKPESFKIRFKKFREAFWALLIIFVIIGGIYGGIFTATEAAGISAVYAFIISVFVYKDIKFKELYGVFLDAAITTAMIFFIIGFAVVFAHFLTNERIPHLIAEFLVAQNMSWWAFLILVNLVLFVMGQFMEPSSVIMIMTPLLLPIALALGIDPIHFGIVMVVNMELGMLTPPVGLNLFVASSLTGLSLKDVTSAVLPWLCVMLVGLLLITYIPQISLWLPNQI